MKKKALVLMAAVLLASSLSAQQNNRTTVTSNDVPIFSGAAIEISVTNQYALGGWSGYAVANLGAELGCEYTLPHFMPLNMDLGFSAHVDYGHTFPKSGTTLKTHESLRATVGAWLRIPFKIATQNFAFQPEVSYGIAANYTVGQNGSTANGWYLDQVVGISPSLRYIPPTDSLKNFEFVLSPWWTFSPEQFSNAVNFLGVKLGVVWHINDFLKK